MYVDYLLVAVFYGEVRKSLVIRCSAVPSTRTVTWLHAFFGDCVCNMTSPSSSPRVQRVWLKQETTIYFSCLKSNGASAWLTSQNTTQPSSSHQEAQISPLGSSLFNVFFASVVKSGLSRESLTGQPHFKLKPNKCNEILNELMFKGLIKEVLLCTKYIEERLCP